MIRKKMRNNTTLKVACVIVWNTQITQKYANTQISGANFENFFVEILLLLMDVITQNSWIVRGL